MWTLNGDDMHKANNILMTHGRVYRDIHREICDHEALHIAREQYPGDTVKHHLLCIAGAIVHLREHCLELDEPGRVYLLNFIAGALSEGTCYDLEGRASLIPAANEAAPLEQEEEKHVSTG